MIGFVKYKRMDRSFVLISWPMPSFISKNKQEDTVLRGYAQHVFEDEDELIVIGLCRIY